MSLFLILINYISTLVALQLLRGDYPSSEATNFGEVWNAFLPIWQVFSSENWTDVLYGAASAEIQLGQTVIVIVFFVSWILFANCESHLPLHIHSSAPPSPPHTYITH
jgi:hypothetical protein